MLYILGPLYILAIVDHVYIVFYVVGATEAQKGNYYLHFVIILYIHSLSSCIGREMSCCVLYLPPYRYLPSTYSSVWNHSLILIVGYLQLSRYFSSISCLASTKCELVVPHHR